MLFGWPRAQNRLKRKLNNLGTSYGDTAITSIRVNCNFLSWSKLHYVNCFQTKLTTLTTTLTTQCHRVTDTFCAVLAWDCSSSAVSPPSDLFYINGILNSAACSVDHSHGNVVWRLQNHIASAFGRTQHCSFRHTGPCDDTQTKLSASLKLLKLIYQYDDHFRRQKLAEVIFSPARWIFVKFGKK